LRKGGKNGDDPQFDNKQGGKNPDGGGSPPLSAVGRGGRAGNTRGGKKLAAKKKNLRLEVLCGRGAENSRNVPQLVRGRSQSDPGGRVGGAPKLGGDLTEQKKKRKRKTALLKSARGVPRRSEEKKDLTLPERVEG